MKFKMSFDDDKVLIAAYLKRAALRKKAAAHFKRAFALLHKGNTILREAESERKKQLTSIKVESKKVNKPGRKPGRKPGPKPGRKPGRPPKNAK